MVAYANISKSKGMYTKLFMVVILGGRIVAVRDLMFPSYIPQCCLSFYSIYYYFCKPPNQ